MRAALKTANLDWTAKNGRLFAGRLLLVSQLLSGLVEGNSCQARLKRLTVEKSKILFQSEKTAMLTYIYIYIYVIILYYIVLYHIVLYCIKMYYIILTLCYLYCYCYDFCHQYYH